MERDGKKVMMMCLVWLVWVGFPFILFLFFAFSLSGGFYSAAGLLLVLVKFVNYWLT